MVILIKKYIINCFFHIPINIYPELYYLPYLTYKGQNVYIDFFDHHGSILNYILAPLMIHNSTSWASFVYICLQILSIYLFTKILIKQVSKKYVLFSVICFFLINTYLISDNLWFEVFIQPLFLLIYYALSQKSHALYIGLLITFTSLIKPTSMFILLLILKAHNKFKIFFYTLLFWLIIFFIYAINGGFFKLIDNLFLFNASLGSYMYANPQFLLPITMIKIFCIGSILSFILLMYTNTLKKVYYPYLFGLASLMFIFPRFEPINLVPALPFFIIFFITSSFNMQNIKYRLLILCIPFLLACFSIYKLVQIKDNLKSRTVYQNEIYPCKIAVLDKKIVPPFYVWGNRPELYFHADYPIRLYHPLVFPFFTYYYKNLEKRIIKDIQSNKIKTIIIPEPKDTYYSSLKELKKYIYEHFTKEKRVDGCLIRIKSK